MLAAACPVAVAHMYDLLEWAARVGAPALAALAFGLGFGEAAIGLDLLVPGEVGMVLVGAVAAAGNTSLPLMVAAGAVGAAAGDSVGYWLGRCYGLRLVERWGWTRRNLGPSTERAREHFARRGGATVFVARFVGALRAVVPVVAGTSRMPYGRFLAWDLPAAVLWASAVVSLGYFVGSEIAIVVDRVGFVISVAVVLAIAAVLLFARHRSRRAGPKQAGTAPADGVPGRRTPLSKSADRPGKG
jgi:membrane protein DedA with SNARE-associated domain